VCGCSRLDINFELTPDLPKMVVVFSRRSLDPMSL
jgi:hypothetical protein